MQVKHPLLDTDFPRRVRYAEWLNQKNVRFMGNVVIGDEAAFFMNAKLILIMSDVTLLKVILRSFILT